MHTPKELGLFISGLVLCALVAQFARDKPVFGLNFSAAGSLRQNPGKRMLKGTLNGRNSSQNLQKHVSGGFWGRKCTETDPAVGGRAR